MDDSGGSGDMGGVGATEVVGDISILKCGVEGQVRFSEFLEEALELLARAAWALKSCLDLLGQGIYDRIDVIDDNCNDNHSLGGHIQ